MNYANKDIRNILVAGHAGCGKTTLIEALLFSTDPEMQRAGTVQDGNTVCAFDPEAQKRHASLAAAVAPVEYDGVKLNFITPPACLILSWACTRASMRQRVC